LQQSRTKITKNEKVTVTSFADKLVRSKYISQPQQ